jgi:hypothetical protein
MSTFYNSFIYGKSFYIIHAAAVKHIYILHFTKYI